VSPAFVVSSVPGSDCGNAGDEEENGICPDHFPGLTSPFARLLVWWLDALWAAVVLTVAIVSESVGVCGVEDGRGRDRGAEV